MTLLILAALCAVVGTATDWWTTKIAVKDYKLSGRNPVTRWLNRKFNNSLWLTTLVFDFLLIGGFLGILLLADVGNVEITIFLFAVCLVQLGSSYLNWKLIKKRRS